MPLAVPPISASTPTAFPTPATNAVTPGAPSTPFAPLDGATVANVLGRNPGAGSSAVAVRCAANNATTPAHGKVTKLFDQFYSHLLDNKRDIWVYLPPSWDPARAADFPIVYMHDGQNLFDPGRGFCGQCWHADRALDDGINAGTLPEAIIVGIDNTPDRIYEMTPSSDGQRKSGGSDKYLGFVVKELMPEVERWLHVKHRRDTTAIIGSSLGGLTSLTAALNYPQVFGRIGALSPSTWWNNEEPVRDIVGLASAMPPVRLYVDSGDSGQNQDAMKETARLAAAIRGLKLPGAFEYRVAPGAAHNEQAWAARLPDVLRFLLGDLVRRGP